MTRLSNGRFRTFTTKDGLPHDVVVSTFQDSEGTYWFSTRGGLARFRDGRFTSYRQNEGVFHDATQRALEDGRGNLWLASNRGISRVSLAELAAAARGPGPIADGITFATATSMILAECNNAQHGAWKGRDGRLWFATVKGLVMADPARIELNPLPPPVVIEQIRADGQALPSSGATARAAGGPAARVRIHGPRVPQSPRRALSLSARGLREGMGRRGPAPDRLLHEPPARPLPLPGARRQRGRRLERDRGLPRSRPRAADRPDRVVPGPDPGRAGRGRNRALSPPHAKARLAASASGRRSSRRSSTPSSSSSGRTFCSTRSTASCRSWARTPSGRGRWSSASGSSSASRSDPRTHRSSRSRRRSGSSRNTFRSSRSGSVTASTCPSRSIRTWPRRGCRASSSSRWSRTPSSTACPAAACAERSPSRRPRRTATSP